MCVYDNDVHMCVVCKAYVDVVCVVCKVYVMVSLVPSPTPNFSSLAVR